MIERARAVSGAGTAGTLVVEPPTACDKAMIRDGVEPKPPAHLKLGERAWWLREIVSAVPTAAIAAMLGATPAEIVEANRGGEWEADLWSAWATSAVRHRDADWAEPLLRGRPAEAPPLWVAGHRPGTPGGPPAPTGAMRSSLRLLRAEPGPLAGVDTRPHGSSGR